MRSTASELYNFKLSDAQVQIDFVRNMLSGYQMLKDAIIVMESPNLGHPSKIRVDGGWETWNRSYPYSNGGHGFRGADPFVGVRIHNEGPLHLHNVTVGRF